MRPIKYVQSLVYLVVFSIIPSKIENIFPNESTKNIEDFRSGMKKSFFNFLLTLCPFFGLFIFLFYSVYCIYFYKDYYSVKTNTNINNKIKDAINLDDEIKKEKESLIELEEKIYKNKESLLCVINKEQEYPCLLKKIKENIDKEESIEQKIERYFYNQTTIKNE